MVFYHPTFDYLKDCEGVVMRVDTLAQNFKPETLGFAWDNESPLIYQICMPETIGYEVLKTSEEVL